MCTGSVGDSDACMFKAHCVRKLFILNLPVCIPLQLNYLSSSCQKIFPTLFFNAHSSQVHLWAQVYSHVEALLALRKVSGTLGKLEGLSCIIIVSILAGLFTYISFFPAKTML